MSLSTELQRIIDAKADIRAAIIAKGVAVDLVDKIDAYAAKIALISGGGGTTISGKVMRTTECEWVHQEFSVVLNNRLLALPQLKELEYV